MKLLTLLIVIAVSFSDVYAQGLKDEDARVKAQQTFAGIPTVSVSPEEEVTEEVSISADAVAKLYDNQSLHRSARFVPFVQNGAAKGVRLFKIAPGSIWQDLKLQDGDVILSCNSRPVLSNRDLRPVIVVELGRDDASTIVYLRGSKKITLNVTKGGNG